MQQKPFLSGSQGGKMEIISRQGNLIGWPRGETSLRSAPAAIFPGLGESPGPTTPRNNDFSQISNNSGTLTLSPRSYSLQN